MLSKLFKERARHKNLELEKKSTTKQLDSMSKILFEGNSNRKKRWKEGKWCCRFCSSACADSVASINKITLKIYL